MKKRNTSNPTWIEITKRAGLILEDPDQIISDLFACVREEAFFTNPVFRFSLRLGVCRLLQQVVELDEPVEKWRTEFRELIWDIFPENLQMKIWDYTFDSLEKFQKLIDVFPSDEERKQHQENRKKLVPGQNTPQPQPLKQRFSKPGTDTWMVACPDCGTEKRCDKRTKRFRCKTEGCDFDKPISEVLPS